jgi:cytochrome c-type biogenesis protein CcmH
MIWIVFALMTSAAVLCALWPLFKKARSGDTEARTLAFYRAQIAEIDRDVSRGQLPATEAEAARAETSRRLIAAARRVAPAERSAKASVFRRRVAALAVLIGVPLVALGLYSRLGSPDERDQPIQARLADPATGGDLNAAVAKIEAHLIAHPEDGRGFKVIAPVYLRLGRYDDAVKAYSEALRLLGEDAELRAGLGEAKVAAAGGLVTAEARAAFQKALSASPELAKARYYMALAAEQDGDRSQAIDLYGKLLAGGPPDAPWAPLVRNRLAALQGEQQAPAPQAKIAAPPDQEARAIASLDPEQRQAAIRGMVEQLAARLETNRDDAAGWLHLIRAYTVLKETDKAKAALAKAREALNRNEAAEHDLDALAHELGLENG